MDREQEVIHKQMEVTRTDLTNKLSALEAQVNTTVQATTDAVQSTTDAVTGTVESVKETVEDVSEKLHDTVEGVTESVQEAVEGVKESFTETVKSVTESLNLKLQAERHPWAVFGGAVAVGALGGFLLGGSSRASRSSGWQPTSTTGTNGSAAAYSPPERAQSADQSDGAGGWLWEQLSGLRGLALGAMMSVVRDLAVKALPETVKDKVSEEVDRITKGIGGEPLKGSLLPEPKEESQGADDRAREFHNDAGSMGRSEAARSGQPATTGSRR